MISKYFRVIDITLQLLLTSRAIVQTLNVRPKPTRKKEMQIKIRNQLDTFVLMNNVKKSTILKESLHFTWEPNTMQKIFLQVVQPMKNTTGILSKSSYQISLSVILQHQGLSYLKKKTYNWYLKNKPVKMKLRKKRRLEKQKWQKRILMKVKACL